MRVLWRRQQRHRSQSRAPQMTWQSFCLDDKRAGANDGERCRPQNVQNPLMSPADRLPLSERETCRCLHAVA